MEKVVLILSGGLDSSTLLYYLLNNGDEVTAITFDYGQKAKIEIEKAKEICKINNVKHYIIDIKNIVNLMKSSLTNKEDNNVEKPINTVVPSRNTILIELATAFAISNNLDAVYYGAIKDDIGDYPDTTIEFLNAINTLNQVNNYKYIPVRAPLINLSKTEVVKKALELNVPIDKTCSCYTPLEDGSPCGKCISCQSRIKAINEVMNNDNSNN